MSTLLTRVAVAITILAVTTACGPSIPEEPPAPLPFKPTGKLAAEVGTGEDTFESLSPSTKVELVSGSQGGQHIWFAARCKGFGSPAKLRYSITNEGGGLISAEHVTVLPGDADEQGWRSRAGLTAFTDGMVTPSPDLPIVFHGRVEDDYGNTLDVSAKATMAGFL